MAKTCPMCNHAMTPLYRYVRRGERLVREVYRYVCTHCSYQCDA